MDAPEKQDKKKSRQLQFILNFQVHIVVLLYVANTRIYTKEFQNKTERKAGKCFGCQYSDTN